MKIQECIVNSGHGPLAPQYFCVHSTGNVGAPAINHVRLWSRGYDYAVHLVSDWHTAYHCVPYGSLCWQVGNGNRYVEGLEICEATNKEDFEKGILIAADVVRQRLKAHGWGVDRLICHQQAAYWWGGSDHTDPLPYFARWGYSWQQFKNLVENPPKNQGKEQPTMKPGDIWDYKIGENATPGLKDWEAWKRLSRTQQHAQNIEKVVCRTDDGGTKDGTRGDLFTRVCYMDMRIREMSATLTAQTEAMKTMAAAIGANPETIASTVEKAVKEKLESLKITMTTQE